MAQDVLSSTETAAPLPAVRTITTADLRDALAKGFDDFLAMPTHAVFLCLIYPIAGIVLGRAALGYEVFPLIYPLAAGFALIGPFAALGLYELSRRRELGLDTSARHAFEVIHSPSRGAILALGLALLVIFGVWIGVAHAIYTANFGYLEPASVTGFLRDVFTTSAGYHLFIWGNSIGFLFAVVVLTVSVTSFPMLLDRDAGLAAAVATSARAVLKNPVPMALWGLIVAAALVIGSLPLFLGLTVVLPVLGHATWHLYRKLVEPSRSPRREQRDAPRGERYAADFPAVLFPWYREDRPK